MQEQLNRIEAALDMIGGQVSELLKRKSTRGSKRKSKAQVHDEAVAGYEYPLWMLNDAVDSAWAMWCDRRKEEAMFMTEGAIKIALASIEGWNDAVRIAALNAASVKPWRSLHPESVCQQIDKGLFREDF